MIKKKGRRPKSYYEDLKKESLIDISNNVITENTITSENDIVAENPVISEDGIIPEVKVHKKRGRKPKGGKIVQVKNILIDNNYIHNVILHLNCSISDIQDNNIYNYSPDINVIDNYNINSGNLLYNFIETDNNNENQENLENLENLENVQNIQNNNIDKVDNVDNVDKFDKNSNQEIRSNENIKKTISNKLKSLTLNIKRQNINKKSACFWCTYNFDNEPIYIPKNEINNKLLCYGCFCSPECACAYLMTENIDTSTKFERYCLLNNTYGKIYNYNKNIKPAPDPRYLLDKFYGNLDIQEYRKLLENERLLLVIDKPLTQILPEIYLENEDYLLSAKIISKK